MVTSRVGIYIWRVSTLSFDFNPMNAANLRLPWLNGRDGMSVVKVPQESEGNRRQGKVSAFESSSFLTPRRKEKHLSTLLKQARASTCVISK